MVVSYLVLIVRLASLGSTSHVALPWDWPSVSRSTPSPWLDTETEVPVKDTPYGNTQAMILHIMNSLVHIEQRLRARMHSDPGTYSQECMSP